MDHTQSQVVVRAVCGGNKGKFSLEHRSAAAPIHSVLHPNTAAAGIQADDLFHLRYAQLTADFNSRLGGAVFDQLKFRCVGIEIRRFINIGLAHFPRRVVQFAGVVEHSQLNGSFQNLAPQLFIIQKGDIAVFVQQQTVLAVLQHVLAATQVGL